MHSADDAADTVHGQRVDQAIADYLRAAEAGQPMPEDRWLGEHPEIAAELQSFLKDRKRLEGWMANARPSVAPLAETIDATGAAGRIPQVGETLRYLGDYELIEELGRGGMGMVFRAHQRKLDRHVAIKMILAGRMSSDKDVARFQAEAEAVAQLDHPNIVSIHEVGAHEGNHYYSMKLIEGTNFSAWLKANRPAKDAPRTAWHAYFQAAAAILATTADAMEYAHCRGVIHRDLKPANILLDRCDKPHVTDFGLARRPADDRQLSVTGNIVGTPAYMAPEQARGDHRAITIATDVHALGAMLYELLTGRPPFSDADLIALLQQVANDVPLAATTLNPKAPRELSAIAEKCLQKEPSRRYPSARAFADDLRNWLEGKPISIRSATLGQILDSWTVHRPLKYTVVLVAATIMPITAITGIVIAATMPSLMVNAASAAESFPGAAKPALLSFGWWYLPFWLQVTSLLSVLGIVILLNAGALLCLRSRNRTWADIAIAMGFWGVVTPAVITAVISVVWSAALALMTVTTIGDINLLSSVFSDAVEHKPIPPGSMLARFLEENPGYAKIEPSKRGGLMLSKIVATQIVGSLDMAILLIALWTANYLIAAFVIVLVRAMVRERLSGLRTFGDSAWRWLLMTPMGVAALIPGLAVMAFVWYGDHSFRVLLVCGILASVAPLAALAERWSIHREGAIA